MNVLLISPVLIKKPPWWLGQLGQGEGNVVSTRDAEARWAPAQFWRMPFIGGKGDPGTSATVWIEIPQHFEHAKDVRSCVWSLSVQRRESQLRIEKKHNPSLIFAMPTNVLRDVLDVCPALTKYK